MSLADRVENLEGKLDEALRLLEAMASSSSHGKTKTKVQMETMPNGVQVTRQRKGKKKIEDYPFFLNEVFGCFGERPSV